MGCTRKPSHAALQCMKLLLQLEVDLAATVVGLQRCSSGSLYCSACFWQHSSLNIAFARAERWWLHVSALSAMHVNMQGVDLSLGTCLGSA